MSRRPIRVAIVADYPEEGWPSMDLVAEMILRHLREGHSGEVEAERVCPTFVRRAGVLPGPARGLRLNADRLLNRYVDYPRHARRLRQTGAFDVYHIVDHSYAQLVHDLPPGRSVVTCHDLDTFRCLLRPDLEPRPAWFRSLTRRTLAGFGRAAAIPCGSEATEAAVRAAGLGRDAEVLTIHTGTHPEYLKPPDPSSVEAADRLIGPPGTSDAPMLLHVGSNIPRKRIDVLLDAFAGLRRSIPAARLVKIGGDLTPEQAGRARSLGLGEGLCILPVVTDRALLAAAYRRASVVLQPSDAEGFGMPLAEAMACGAPLLVSDLPVHREVAGDAALYRPVGHVDAWVAGLLEILGDAEAREARVAAGLERSTRYRWDRHARRLAALYREVEGRAAVGGGMPVA